MAAVTARAAGFEIAAGVTAFASDSGVGTVQHKACAEVIKCLLRVALGRGKER